MISALMLCSWTAVAVRDDGSKEGFGHVAAREGIGSGAASQFSSCICETDVDGNRLPVIMVTQQFEACETRCRQMCPHFQKDATFFECLVVHTEDGTTGNDLAMHVGLRPNIVGPFQAPELDLSKLPPMLRHDTYLPENLFSACVCMGNKNYFLAGKKDYFGGLQVWGRTGCMHTGQFGSTCDSACNPLGATPKTDGACILTTMTNQPPSETPSQLPMTGYAIKPLTLNLEKLPGRKKS